MLKSTNVLYLAAAAALAGVAAAVPQARGDVFTNVPEAAGYQLVYTLNIPTANPNYNTGTPVNYAVDNSGAVADGSFDRIAYYLELQPVGGGALQYAYVSMDAFTTEADRTGVPTVASGAAFQQNVTNASVVSNAPGVTNGTTATGVNIEFWPNNYGTANAAAVPNATNETYDTGDSIDAGTVAGYGSMQIHNHEAGNEVILAYNRWGNFGADSDVGIGSNLDAAGHPDYTFASNAGQYEVRNLQVLVRPIPEPAGLTLLAAGGLALLGRGRRVRNG